MRIASPTAASAAATVITMKANTEPVGSPKYDPTAMKATLTALSMISTLMMMMSAFLRATTPTTPIPNRMPESSRYADGSIIRFSPSDLLLRQRDGPDHRPQQQHRGDLEREQVSGEQRPSHRLDRTRVRRRPPRHRVPPRQDRALEDQQPRRRDPEELQRRQPLHGKPVLRHVDEHDDEDEQDHDRPGVDDDLDRRQEMGLPQDEERRHGEQRQDQAERRGHRVPPRHHQDRAGDRDRAEDDEQ